MTILDKPFMLDTHRCIVTKDVDVSCLHLHVFLGNRGISTCLVAVGRSSSKFFSWRHTLFASKHSTPAEEAQDMFVGDWCALTCPMAGDCATSLCLGANAPFISRGTETFMLSSQLKDVTLQPIR